MSSDRACADICRDLNTLCSWLALDTFSVESNPTRTIRVIVLFGNQVIPTLTAACKLAHAHPEALLLFSGGLGHATRFLFENIAASDFAPLFSAGQITSNLGEAQIYAAVARHAFSIPATRILVEAQSTNGGENSLFSLRILHQQGLANSPVLLLQDPVMQRRSVLTWQRQLELLTRESEIQFDRAEFAPPFCLPCFVPTVETGPDNLPRLIPSQSQGTWTFPRYIGLVLGEIARLHDDENGYGPRGKNFIPHVDIPADVWASYQRILSSPIAASACR